MDSLFYEIGLVCFKVWKICTSWFGTHLGGFLVMSNTFDGKDILVDVLLGYDLFIFQAREW